MNSRNIIKSAAIADLIGHIQKQSYENPLFAGRATTPNPNEGAFNPNAAPQKFQEPIGFNAPKINPNAGGFNPVKINPPRPTPAKPAAPRPAPNRPTITPNPQSARPAPNTQGRPNTSGQVNTPAPRPAAPRPAPNRPQTPLPPTVPVNNPIQTNRDGSILSDSSPGSGYTLVGYSGGKKKWSQSVPTPQPTQPTQQTQATARPSIPFKTKFDMNTGTVVPIQGTPDATYNNYMAAQQRVRNYEGTDEEYSADGQTVSNYLNQDVLSRTQQQIQEAKEEEKAGLTQAGRYIGPTRYSDEYYAALRNPNFRYRR